MYSGRYSCSILTKFGFSGHIFVKVPNVRFHVNSSSGSRRDTCGRTDGRSDVRNEANRRSSRQCECSKEVNHLHESHVCLVVRGRASAPEQLKRFFN
jgi:hypothetical protein